MIWKLTSGIVQNPSLGGSCRIITGQSYCVERNFGIPEAEPTTVMPIATTATTTKASPTVGNGIATPRPTQPGITGNCNKFYKPAKDEDCGAVLTSQGITWDDFYSWNQGVGSNCEKMWADTNHCVGKALPPLPPCCPKPFFFPQLTVHAGVLGGSTGGSSTSVAATKTTKSASTMSTMTRGNGISTPQPTMPGMTAKCDKFYKVQKGEGCWDVTDKNDISQADFYAWNTGLGADCEKMWSDAYVCVHGFN